LAFNNAIDEGTSNRAENTKAGKIINITTIPVALSGAALLSGVSGDNDL